MRILLAHTSLSGNTRDVARAIHARCEALGHAVTWIDADIQNLAKVCPDGAEHDLYVLGSWSINAGRTPPEMKRFIEDLVAAVGKPERLAVFGTGETQWGEEHYCGAARRMAAFFGTRYPRLEIEQMPHGEHDATKIQRWTDTILALADTPFETIPMQTLHATTPDDYAAALAAHPRLLVDYYKDDCPGCKMLDMSLAKFAASEDAAGVALLKVKLEVIGEDFFRTLGLRQTPTLALFKDGTEAARLPGFQAPGQIAQAVGLHLTTADAG